MGKSRGHNNIPRPQPKPLPRPQPKPVSKTSSSFLDVMEDGREFESLLKYSFINANPILELRTGLQEIATIRKRACICYVANVVSPTSASISIDDSDDLPFSEMIASLPKDVKDIDIVLVTPGGFAKQVAKFVNKLRPRFDSVAFIILNKSMSAGTIFAMSGDEIIMADQSQIGPIDPQVPSKNGGLLPAQSLMTLIDDIQKRGEALIRAGKKPLWTDLHILSNLDPKEVGNAINASKYSVQLVEQYLLDYKFKNWFTHSDGTTPVTLEEKKKRANEIAELLCDNSKWKIHGHAITREAAWDVCKLKITHAENINGMDRAMKRLWALFYWVFENTPITKIFLSDNYCIIRQDNSKKDTKK